MSLTIKLLLVIEMAIIFPILFFKFCRFVSNVFMLDKALWKNWEVFLRVNLWLVTAVYVIAAAGIAINFFIFLDTSDAGSVAPQVLLAAEQTSPAQPQKIPIVTNSRRLSASQWNREHKVKKIENSRPGKIPFFNNPQATGLIKLGKSRKFVANWIVVQNGLRISRLGEGPMKAAGMRVGDTLTHLNSNPITGEKELLQARDFVYNNSGQEAMITVARDQEQVLYRLAR